MSNYSTDPNDKPIVLDGVPMLRFIFKVRAGEINPPVV